MGLVSVKGVVGCVLGCAVGLGTAWPAAACPPLPKQEAAREQIASTRAEVVVATPAPSPAPRAETEIEASIPPVEVAVPVELPVELPADVPEWFGKAGRAVGLADMLEPGREYTLLLPTDQAYRELNEATRMALDSPRNAQKLRTLLAYHIVPGRITAKDLIGTTELQTLAGPTLSVDASFGGIRIGRARLLDSVEMGSVGVVHHLDSVLIPEGMKLLPDGPLLLGMYVRRPDSKTLSDLGLNRSEALVVTSLVDGANAGPAGVVVGDIVVSIDGKPASVEAGRSARKEHGVGGSVELVVLRDGKRVRISVPVGIDPR